MLALIACNECKSLQDAYVDAVRALGVLNERHTRAVLEDDANSRVIDVLIREAGAEKQAAKHAYIQHRRAHHFPKLGSSRK